MTEFILFAGIRVILITLLVLVFIQDLKERLINVALLVSVFITSLVLGFFVLGAWVPFAINTAMNLAFIFIQACLLSAYIIFRFKVSAGSILEYIGLGDFLFWIAICPLITFHDFVIHFIASLLLALLLHTMFRQFPLYKVKSVPLAGMQGMYYAVVVFSQLGLVL